MNSILAIINIFDKILQFIPECFAEHKQADYKENVSGNQYKKIHNVFAGSRIPEKQT